MQTTTAPFAYQIKRAYARNPQTGRSTRTQIGWRLLREGELIGQYGTRDMARRMRAYYQQRDAMEAARQQRLARLQYMLTALAAVLAFVSVVLGVVSIQPDAIAAPTIAAPVDVAHVVRALALPQDVAFRALFGAQ